MRPLLVSWGSLELSAYETALVAGACLLVWLTVRTATRRGLPRRETALTLMAAYAVGLLGARLLFAVEASASPRQAWATLVRPSVGGYSSLGGLLLGAAAAAAPGGGGRGGGGAGAPAPAAGLRMSFARLADASTVALCLAGAVGRVGCLLAGCCHGSPTNLPWGVAYPEGSPAAALFGPGVSVHPTPLYEALALLVLAGFLSPRPPGLPRPGAQWRLFVFGYAILRLLTDFTRGDVARYASLSLAQWIAVGGLAAVIVMSWVRGWQGRLRRGMRRPLGVYP
jgi:phosphatidylglycerol:prolipoprotein diacylglycerol transferase